MDLSRLRAFFERRHRAYNLSLQRSNPAVTLMLADYADFCCVNKTTANGDNPYKTARMEGRREAFLFLTRAMQLTPEEQLALVQQKDQL